MPVKPCFGPKVLKSLARVFLNSFKPLDFGLFDFCELALSENFGKSISDYVSQIYDDEPKHEESVAPPHDELVVQL